MFYMKIKNKQSSNDFIKLIYPNTNQIEIY